MSSFERSLTFFLSHFFVYALLFPFPSSCPFPFISAAAESEIGKKEFWSNCDIHLEQIRAHYRDQRPGAKPERYGILCIDPSDPATKGESP